MIKFNMRKFRQFIGGLGVLAFLGLSAGNAFAAVTVMGGSTTNISSDTATSDSTALPVITLTEGSAADIPVGTLTFVLPSGFVFDTTSIANVTATGTGLSVSGVVSFGDSTHASVIVTATSTVAGSVTIGATTPLKVKAIAGNPKAATGNIMLSAGMLTGLASTTTFGTLTQVSGSPAKLAFTIQPPTALSLGSTFGATVSVEDQFGNVVTSDSGRAINVSISAINPTSTTGSLSGIVNMVDASGLATYSGLSFNQSGTIALSASSSGLTAALSGNIVLSITNPTTTPPTTTPSTSCNLRNGMLVKVGNSSTIYMVVNCVLRPFNSAAIFHARGKKFEDVVTIPGLGFGIGKPVGEGRDDDDTVILPPTSSTSTASTTLPSVSGLPDGTIVKIPNNPTIYMVSGGTLQPFTSLAVFTAHKKSFKDVKIISQDQFNSLTVGDPVSFPDGTLIKGSGNTIFVVQGGVKMAIPSLDSLKRHGQSLRNLFKISDGELNHMNSGHDQD